MLECGSVLIYLGWNPWLGDPLFEDRPTGEVDPETGEPVVEKVPIQDEQGRQLHSGAIEMEVVSGYEIEVDPMSTSPDDAQWMMRNKIRTLRWIKENYAQKGMYVKTEEVYIHSFYEKRIRQMVGILGYSGDAQVGESDQGAPQDSAIVHEYWEKSSAKYPQGRLVVVAGEVLLHDGPNPYKHQLFPYIKIDEITISGRFWGMAIIEQAIPLQRNLNRARSQEVENRTLMGRPKILVPRTAKMRQTAFDGEAGEKLDYHPGPRGEKPELLWPQSTTISTQTEIQHTLNDFQEVTAWHEVSRGILPSANLPGIAIEKLQTADETSMGSTATNIDEALKEMGHMILALAAQFWDEERMVRAGGEDARLESMMLRGQDIQGDDPKRDYFDVSVVPNSTLLKDPVQQRSKVRDMSEMRILDPVRDRELIIKTLDVADADEIFADERLDEQWAQRENDLMEGGMFSIPKDWEDHAIHLKVLNRYRKSERFRRLPPQVQEQFALHAQIHEALAVQVAMKQASAQMEVQATLMGGAPAGNPAAKKPPGERAGSEAGRTMTSSSQRKEEVT